MPRAAEECMKCLNTPEGSAGQKVTFQMFSQDQLPEHGNTSLLFEEILDFFDLTVHNSRV